MERSKAVATAAAITMVVSSALFAVGAGTGVFGSRAPAPPAPPAQAASVTTNSTTTNSRTTSSASTGSTTVGGHSGDHSSGSSEQTQSRGESDD